MVIIVLIYLLLWESVQFLEYKVFCIMIKTFTSQYDDRQQRAIIYVWSIARFPNASYAVVDCRM